MASGPPDPKEIGFYWSLAQVGFEMVVPIALGVFLDNRFGWTPWAAIVGAVFGFAGGLGHLILLLNRHDRPRPGNKRERL